MGDDPSDIPDPWIRPGLGLAPGWGPPAQAVDAVPLKVEQPAVKGLDVYAERVGHGLPVGLPVDSLVHRVDRDELGLERVFHLSYMETHLSCVPHGRPRARVI